MTLQRSLKYHTRVALPFPLCHRKAPGETTPRSNQLISNRTHVRGIFNKNAKNLPFNLSGVSIGAGSRDTDQVNTEVFTSESDIYKAAYDYVLSGYYKAAEQDFQQYLQDYPKGTKPAETSYWLGEAQYSQGKCNESAKKFLNGHQNYGKLLKLPENLIKLGISLAVLDNNKTA